jgi:S1-C subfamily serine protease
VGSETCQRPAHRVWRRLGVLAAAGLVVALSGGGVLAVAATQREGPTGAAAPRAVTLEGGYGSIDLARAVDEASAGQSAGLVEITSTLVNGQAAGTGLIWTASGLVVTNQHVVAGATSIRVTVVSTGGSYDAVYVGDDPGADVAVLRLHGVSGLTTLRRSAALRVGSPVTVVGDANGDGGALSAATGNVLATGQDIIVQGDVGPGRALHDLVEISADVVPGDSGGAVLDARGDVVAMTVALARERMAVTGYAIPIDVVRSVVRRILARWAPWGSNPQRAE